MFGENVRFYLLMQVLCCTSMLVSATNTFQVVNQTRTFRAAQAHCRSIQMHLASIHSAVEESYIVTLVGNTTTATYWIGMVQIFGQQMWLDGTARGYTNFASVTHDSFFSDYHCIQLSVNNGVSQWHQQECGMEEFFICRKEVPPDTTTPQNIDTGETTATTMYFSTTEVTDTTTTAYTNANIQSTGVTTTQEVTTNATRNVNGIVNPRPQISTTTIHTTEIFTTELSTTESPTTELELQTTELPTTEYSTTELPTTKQMTTELISTTQSPTTETPTTELSTTEGATTQMPTTDSPTTKLATTQTETTLVSTSVASTTNATNTTDPLPPISGMETVKLLQSAEQRSIKIALSSTSQVPDSGNPRVEIQIRRSTAKESSSYNETVPFIQFSQTNLNRLIPVGINDTETFITVSSQIKEDKANLQFLLEASPPSSNLHTTNHVLDNPTIITITALTLQASLLQAAVEFNFNLSKDDTARTVYRPEIAPSAFSGTRNTKRVEYNCRYIDYKTGAFSELGCHNQPSILMNYHQCSCNHSTPFAVLLSVTSYKVPGAVKIISFVTEAMSVICLFVTLVILCVAKKKIRSDRTIVQINLTIALLLLHIFTLLHDAVMFNFRLCEMAAILIHLFLLASAMWGLIEGVTLVWKTLENGSLHKLCAWQITARSAIGWGTPCLIVVIAVAIGFSMGSYMEDNPDYLIDPLARRYNRCTVKPGSGVMIGALVIPVATILLINFVIVMRMAYFVYMMSKRTEEMKPSNNTRGNTAVMDGATLTHTVAAFKAMFVLFPILGIPWIVGFLVGIEHIEVSITFMYISSILNGLQGVFVFLLYCVFSSDVRAALKNEYNKAQAQSQFRQERSVFSQGDDSKTKFKLTVSSLNPIRSRKSSEITKAGTMSVKKKPDKTDNLVLGMHISVQGTYRRRNFD